MTRSHAKNNTSGSVFTYYERHRTDYGTKTQRIGADSMKRIDSCNLCLATARNPVACNQGHLYCKECILSSLISQKSLIKSHQASLLAHHASELAQQQKIRSEARARVLSDFEKGIALGSTGSGAGYRTKATDGAAPAGNETDSSESRGVKRKAEEEDKSGGSVGTRFSFDPAAVEKLALAAEEAAMISIEKEQQEARRTKLPSFWLPTLTPDAKVGPLNDVKLSTVCSLGEVAHPLSLKSLLPVIFTYASSSTSSTSTAPTPSSTPSCPSCSREITNSVKTVLLTSRSLVSSSTTDTTPNDSAAPPPTKKSKKEKQKEENVCGHVICGTCADTIVKPGQQCPVCEAVIRADKGEIIELGREGTGYAAAGGAVVKKAGVAFQ